MTVRTTSEAFVDDLDAGQRRVVSSFWLGVAPCKHMRTACETRRCAMLCCCAPLPPSQAAHSCYFLRPQLRMYCDGDSAVGSMPVRAVHACNAQDPMPANTDVASHILNGCQGGRGCGRWNPDDLNDGDVLHPERRGWAAAWVFHRGPLPGYEAALIGQQVGLGC